MDVWSLLHNLSTPLDFGPDKDLNSHLPSFFNLKQHLFLIVFQSKKTASFFWISNRAHEVRIRRFHWDLPTYQHSSIHGVAGGRFHSLPTCRWNERKGMLHLHFAAMILSFEILQLSNVATTGPTDYMPLNAFRCCWPKPQLHQNLRIAEGLNRAQIHCG